MAQGAPNDAAGAGEAEEEPRGWQRSCRESGVRSHLQSQRYREGAGVTQSKGTERCRRPGGEATSVWSPNFTLRAGALSLARGWGSGCAPGTGQGSVSELSGAARQRDVWLCADRGRNFRLSLAEQTAFYFVRSHLCASFSLLPKGPVSEVTRLVLVNLHLSGFCSCFSVAHQEGGKLEV